MSEPVPYPAFRFEVSLGEDRLAFAEVEGLGQSRRVLAYRNGTDPAPRFVVDDARPQPVTLRRGIVGTLELHRWYQAADPRDVEVRLLDAEGQPVQRWRLRRCVPVALQGPRLGSLRNEVAIEALVLQAASIDVE